MSYFEFPAPTGAPVEGLALLKEADSAASAAASARGRSPSADSRTASVAAGAAASQGGSEEDKRFWMPDDACTVCYKCELPFSLLRRRHHCRVCGLIFCRACSARTVKVFGQQGAVRVCDSCYDIARSSRPSQSQASFRAFQAAAAAAAAEATEARRGSSEFGSFDAEGRRRAAASSAGSPAGSLATPRCAT